MSYIMKEEIRKIVREEFLKLVDEFIPEVSSSEQKEIEEIFGKRPKKFRRAKEGLEWIGESF